MKILRIASALWLTCLGLIVSQAQTVAPAEQLLPDDTFGVFTIPSWNKLQEAQSQSAWGRLWADPSMKPFRDNLTSNLQADFLKPLEKQIGVDFATYAELLQGQITLAMLPPREDSAEFASFLFLMDSGPKSELLSAKLAELKKKWTESGKELRMEKIRDLDFGVVSVSRADVEQLLQNAFPSPEGKNESTDAAKENIELFIGQSKSLLIVSESKQAVEKLLARQNGGLVPPLAEQASYQKSHSLLFRDSLAHGWINVKPVYEKVLQLAAREKQEDQAPGMPSMKLEKILPALGLSSLKSIAANLSMTPEGSSFDLFASVPEAQREGIFKILTLEKKDATPPAFVPADVVKFQRSRINAQQAWATFEGMLSKIDPSLAGLVQLMLSSAGKDQDPNFDLKKNLIGNLGDDFIQYEKAPRGTSSPEIASPPSLFLIGSPNAPALADALRAVTSLLPPPLSSAPLQEREFLGRKIYSLSMAIPAAENGAAAPPAQLFSFVASGGYLALSGDTPLLEEYLRSNENPPKPLRSAPEFAQTLPRVGGGDDGYLSYDDQRETVRIIMLAIKNDPEAFGKLLFLGRGEEGGREAMTRFFDLKLLPDYDRISKYLGIGVTSASTTSDGFLIKAFGPRPKSISN